MCVFQFIQKYYREDKTRLGKLLPPPIIHKTKMAGKGDRRVLISWGNEGQRKWEKASVFSLLDSEGEEAYTTLRCNTMKV